MAIPSMEELNLMHDRICRSVGDPKRLQILYALHEQPRHVTALAEALDLPQSTTSRHLTMLRQRGLVIAERDGASMVYHIADPRIIEVMNMMRQVLREMVAKQNDVMK